MLAKSGQKNTLVSATVGRGGDSFHYGDHSDEAEDETVLPQTGAALQLKTDAGGLSQSASTDGCIVSALRWQHGNTGILLAGYTRKDTTSNAPLGKVAPDGFVLTWDVEQGEPQRMLKHTARISALVAPHPMSPALVIAGSCYGDLLAWDTRSSLSFPSLKTQSASKRPVRGLATPDSSSPFVISASSDGTISAWSLSNLSVAQDSFQVRERGLRDVRPSAIAIPANASFQKTPGTDALGKRAAVLIAGEDGGLYRADNAEQAWTVHHAAARHDAQVTSVDAHPGHSRFLPLRDLVATTSVDGSVNLWSFGRRNAGLRILQLRAGSLDTSTDVHWAPGHPGVFAASDRGGGVSLFDISKSQREMLLGRYEVSQAGKKHSGSGAERAGMSRIRWSADGKVLATGDVDGRIHVWGAGESVFDPADSSWESATSTVKQLRAHASKAVGTEAELNVPSSYVFKGIPPIFNPLAK